MSKHFCCCIPVRFGVFIMSLSMFLGWAAISGIIIFGLEQILTKANKYPTITLNLGQKIGLGVAGGIYAIFAVISLFGFIGAITRKRGFVATYSKLLWFLFIVNVIVVVGINVLIWVFRGKDYTKFQDACNNATDLTPAEKADCLTFVNDLHAVKFAIGWAVSSAINLLWNLYGCIIVARYVKQLDEELAYSVYTRDPAFDSRTKSYYPHDPINNQTELLNAPTGGYAYSDPHHSFGAKA